MRNGSLRVASGDRIVAGQQIASVGNSGNSAAPHLHLQVNDGRNLLDSKIREFGFTRCDRWTGKSWETILGTAPVKGDLIRFYD
ncbi:MAG: M23 family metallopeptidase [Anaerolineae bacterium]